MLLGQNAANANAWKYGHGFQQHPTSMQHPNQLTVYPFATHFPAFWSPFEPSISPYPVLHTLMHDPHSYFPELSAKTADFRGGLRPADCLTDMQKVAKWEAGNYMRSKM